MLELDGVLGLLLIGLWLYCLLDVITSPAEAVRNLPKPLWLMVVLLLPDVGSVLWLVAGRPRGPRAGRADSSRASGLPQRPGPARRPRAPRRPAPLAPDDDPEFLRSLSRPKDEPPTP